MMVEEGKTRRESVSEEPGGQQCNRRDTGTQSHFCSASAGQLSAVTVAEIPLFLLQDKEG